MKVADTGYDAILRPSATGAADVLIEVKYSADGPRLALLSWTLYGLRNATSSYQSGQAQGRVNCIHCVPTAGSPGRICDGADARLCR